MKPTDEMIEESAESYSKCWPDSLARKSAYLTGARDVAEHMQSEIDAANRWWASRWQEWRNLNSAAMPTDVMLMSKHRVAFIREELDAKAREVLGCKE